MGDIEFDRAHLCALEDLYRENRIEAASLCGRCSSGHLYRRRSSPDLSVYCQSLGRYVPADIVECTAFEAVTALRLQQMADIALTIDAREGISKGSYR